MTYWQPVQKPSSESEDCEDGFAHVVERSFANNSPSQDSNHPDDRFQSSIESLFATNYWDCHYWFREENSVGNLTLILLYIFEKLFRTLSTFSTENENITIFSPVTWQCYFIASSGSFRETWNCFGHSIMVSNISRKISRRNENLFGYISMGFTSFPLKICVRVPVDINFELLKNCGN